MSGCSNDVAFLTRHRREQFGGLRAVMALALGEGAWIGNGACVR